MNSGKKNLSHLVSNIRTFSRKSSCHGRNTIVEGGFNLKTHARQGYRREGVKTFDLKTRASEAALPIGLGRAGGRERDTEMAI